MHLTCCLENAASSTTDSQSLPLLFRTDPLGFERSRVEKTFSLGLSAPTLEAFFLVEVPFSQGNPSFCVKLTKN